MNISDIKVAKELIQEAGSIFNLNINVVTGDVGCDSEDLLKFIINDLNAASIIPHNPRREQPKGWQIKGDKVICEAGREMIRKGKMRPQKTGILYCKCICTIIYDKNSGISILRARCFTQLFQG